jgi:hypothetical protein
MEDYGSKLDNFDTNDDIESEGNKVDDAPPNSLVDSTTSPKVKTTEG